MVGRNNGYHNQIINSIQAILHIAASYKPAYIYGGPIMSVAKLCECLITAQNGFDPAQPDNLNGTAHYDIEVYTTLANGKEELNFPEKEVQLIDGVPVRYFKRITGDHSHLSPALYKYLNQTVRQFDLVHIHAWWNLATVFSCMIALKKGVKVILTPRGTLSSYSFGNRTSIPKRLFHQLFGKRLLQRCHFHVTSEKEKRDTLTLLKPRSIYVIPNFVYMPEIGLSKSKRQSSTSMRLLFLSRVEEKKGLELLFETLKDFKAGWSLSIAGSGIENYINTLKELSKKLGINSKIEWLGQVDNEVKFDVMQKHDLLVLPSYDENFANVVIECLSTGTAVLVTENVGLVDYVIEKQFGWVCKRDKDSLLASLNEAANNVEKLDEIRRIAPEIIRKDYNETALVEQYLEMYLEVIKA